MPRNRQVDGPHALSAIIDLPHGAAGAREASDKAVLARPVRVEVPAKPLNLIFPAWEAFSAGGAANDDTVESSGGSRPVIDWMWEHTSAPKPRRGGGTPSLSV